jgi:hypothetical protein
MCLAVNVIARVFNVNFRKLGCLEWRWLGVFIDSNHFLVVGWVCCRWAHRTVRWCTVQGTVHCTMRATLARSWDLEWLTVGTLCPVAAPDSPVPHRTCPVRSDFTAWHLTSALCAFIVHAVDRCAPGYRCSVGSLDMSGAHRTVRWIIADSALEKLESG